MKDQLFFYGIVGFITSLFVIVGEPIFSQLDQSVKIKFSILAIITYATILHLHLKIRTLGKKVDK